MNSTQLKTFRLLLEKRRNQLLSQYCSDQDTPEEAAIRAALKASREETNRLSGLVMDIDNRQYASKAKVRQRIDDRITELELDALMGTLDSSAADMLRRLEVWDPEAGL